LATAGAFSSVASNDNIDPVFVHEIGNSGALFSHKRFLLFYKRSDEINVILLNAEIIKYARFPKSWANAALRSPPLRLA